jgi:hypothetical protein
MTKRYPATHRWVGEKFVGSFANQAWHSTCINCGATRERRWDDGQRSQRYRENPHAPWGEGFPCKPTNKEPT